MPFMNMPNGQDDEGDLGGYGDMGGGGFNAGGDWNSGSNGIPDQGMGDSYLGGLYGSIYNPTASQWDEATQTGNDFYGLPGSGDFDDGATSAGGDVYNDQGGNDSVYGQGFDSQNEGFGSPLGGGEGSDSENGLDVNSDLYDSGDQSAAQGAGGQPGSWTSSAWDFLNSKLGKLGTGVLSLAFPSIGLPMMAARTALGFASDHGGQAIGSDIGGIAQGAMGLPGMALGAMGMGPASFGASVGKDFDNGTGMFGNTNNYGGNQTGFNGGYGSQGQSQGMYGGMGMGGGLSGIFGNNAYGNGGNTSAVSPGDSLAGGLGGYFLGQSNQAGINSQINNLNSLYAPNSPYAQQMQQSLERQDAARGMRSQYGTRSVELQAALANAASRNAPTLANLYGQGRDQRTMQYLSLLGAGRNMGLFNGLGGMFGQGGNNGATITPDQGSWSNQTQDLGFGG